jgi:hypothetical protein
MLLRMIIYIYIYIYFAPGVSLCLFLYEEKVMISANLSLLTHY